MSVSDKIFCTNCGHQISTQYLFCPFCGHKMDIDIYAKKDVKHYTERQLLYNKLVICIKKRLKYVELSTNIQKVVQKLPWNIRWLYRKELARIPYILHNDENIKDIISCSHKNQNGLLIATNKQIIFVSLGLSNNRKLIECFPYSKISLLIYNIGIFSKSILIFYQNNYYKMKPLKINSCKLFYDHIQPLMPNPKITTKVKKDNFMDTWIPMIRNIKKKYFFLMFLIILVYFFKATLFIILLLISVLILIIGMINPKYIMRWDKEKFAKRSYIIMFSSLLFTTSIIGVINTLPTPSDEKQQPASQTSSSPIKNSPSIIVDDDASTQILGTPREKIRRMFLDKGYTSIKSYAVNDDGFNLGGKSGQVDVHVIYDENNIAKGVDFISLDGSLNGDGSDSYVYKHYDELIQWSTGGSNVKTKTDLDYATPELLKLQPHPRELYIGDDENE